MSAPRTFSKDGKAFFTKYQQAATGPFYYHGTMARLGDSINSSGMRPGNPNGNWTTDLPTAQRFAGERNIVNSEGQTVRAMHNGYEAYHPIYRTRVPGGRSVNDEVVSGGMVKPQDMSVSYDNGITWEPVDVLNARTQHAKAYAQATKDVVDDLSKHFDDRGFGYDPTTETAQQWLDEASLASDMENATFRSDNVSFWMEPNSPAKVFATETERLIKGRSVGVDPRDAAVLVKTGAAVEKAGQYYYTLPKEIAIPFMSKAGEYQGVVRFHFAPRSATPSKNFYPNIGLDANLTGMTFDDMGGRAYLWDEMIDDAMEHLRLNGTPRLVKQAMEQPLIKKRYESRGGFGTSEPELMALWTPDEVLAIERYSAGASQRLNQPLRDGLDVSDIESAGVHMEEASGSVVAEHEIEILDRAIHKGKFPEVDDVDDLITYRYEGPDRYGQKTQEYIDFVDSLQPGDDFHYKAPLSTSGDIAQAKAFGADADVQIEWIVHNKPGQPVAFMDSFQEVERLLPRNTSFHTVSRTTQWMNPKGAPTQAMLLDARRAVWDDIANGLQEHIDKAMTVHGFLPYHTEKAIGDLIVDIRKQMDLNPVSDVAQVIVQGGSRQHQMHELIDYLRGESAQRRASVQKNNTGHLPHPDYELTFDELNDAYEAVLGQMDDQFVRDMGRVIRLEVENLGDDWIDPVKIRDAVTDTIDNGGGTFHAKTMDPYSPAEHGGLAVGLYEPPTGAPTGFKVVDRTDATAIKAAIDETVEAFPTADYVGTWVDPANPTKVYINPTKVFPRAARQEAMALARMHRQKTLFDYDLMNTVETPRAYNMDRRHATEAHPERT
jgi:hypothetical protein